MLQRIVVTALKRLLVSCNDASPFAIALQTGLYYSEITIEIGLLLKIAYPDATAQSYLSVIKRFFAGYYLQQRTLALSIAGNESDALTLLNNKRNVAEKHKVAKTLGYVLYLEVYCHNSQFAREDNNLCVHSLYILYKKQ
jgi:hypothetical protein